MVMLPPWPVLLILVHVRTSVFCPIIPPVSLHMLKLRDPLAGGDLTASESPQAGLLPAH